MLHVVVASKNPAKIEATKMAFEAVFGKDCCKIENFEVSSGVSEQPMGDKETRTGARQRAMTARTVRPEADFWIGIEAGIDENMTYSWIAIETAKRRGEARTAGLPLPGKILSEIKENDKTLGEAMHGLTGIENMGQRGGAISYFTDGLLTRDSVYSQALILALASLRHEAYD